MTLMPAFLPKESSALLTREFAIHAAELLQDPQHAGEDEVSLQNIYRLLEMYRFDAFVGYTPKGILDIRDIRRRSDVNAVAGGVLKRALDEAKERVFPQVAKEAVVDLLERIVSALAGRTAHNPVEMQQARRFFEELATALKAA